MLFCSPSLFTPSLCTNHCFVSSISTVLLPSLTCQCVSPFIVTTVDSMTSHISESSSSKSSSMRTYIPFLTWEERSFLGGILVGCLMRVFWGVRMRRRWSAIYRVCLVLLILARLLLEERPEVGGGTATCWYIGRLRPYCRSKV